VPEGAFLIFEGELVAFKKIYIIVSFFAGSKPSSD